jgi:hypothetical protein
MKTLPVFQDLGLMVITAPYHSGSCVSYLAIVITKVVQ